jgi:hypothetical protein
VTAIWRPRRRYQCIRDADRRGVPKIEDLHPVGVDDAAGGANEAPFVANRHNRIATDNEFVGREFPKLERFGKGHEVLLDFFAPAPRTRHAGDDRRKKLTYR